MIWARHGRGPESGDGSCNARHTGCMHGAALVFTMDHMILRLCVPCYLRLRDEGDLLLAQACPPSQTT